jgi:hypothetical protein
VLGVAEAVGRVGDTDADGESDGVAVTVAAAVDVCVGVASGGLGGVVLVDSLGRVIR